MWDKIKEYVYGAVGVVVAILAALLYGSNKKNEALKGKVSELEGEKSLRKELQDYENAKQDADQAQKDYESLRDSSDKSDSNSKG